VVDLALIRQVRVLIADVGSDPLLDDLTIDAYLELNLVAGAPAMRLAAADAMEKGAVSEVLVSKKIRTNDLATEGPAVSAELRALARQLRERAKALADAADIFDGFDLVDTLPACACGRTELTPCPHIVTGM